MKCNSCETEWKANSKISSSITACPFCGAPIANEKKSPRSLDNVTDTLVFIKEQFGVDTLLGDKAYTFFADLTHNQLRDETDLIKQFCDKGALDCLKAAIGNSKPEHELAVKRSLSKLPKYLQDSPVVTDMLHDFTTALGWTIQRQITAPHPKQTPVATQRGYNTRIIVAPPIGSVENISGIDWRVLAVENNKALLISEKILEKRSYNVKFNNITWENCTLRKYLNGEFLKKFGAMQPKIAETRMSNPNNPWYRTSGGNVTADKIFLLSLDEIVKYFGDSGDLRNRKGWIYENGKHVLVSGSGYYIHDQYDSKRIANYGGEGAWWWWLRSFGENKSKAAGVSNVGTLNLFGSYVDNEEGGVRPALWLNL